MNCKQLPPNCRKASPDGMCTSCDEGYSSVNNVCTKKTLTIPNCKIVDSVNNRCAVCEDNYIPTPNGCVQKDPYCGVYDPVSGICVDCMPGYV